MGRKKKEKMESLDKRYMLFLFGDFSLTEAFADDISYQLISVVSSKSLKFNYGEFGMVCHFRSGETFDNLKEYTDMVLSEITEQYFLVEVGESFDIKMDRKLKKEFLNIDGEKTENKTGSIEVNEVSVKTNKKEMDNMFHMLFPIMDPNFFKTEEEKQKEPSVDEILDRISEEGVESLTEREKQILDNYGTRKNGGNQIK
jgi:hypothetical protein